MQSIAVSIHESGVDIVARIVAIAGVVIASGSLLLTWHQWRHSGPDLDTGVEAYVDKERVGRRDEQWIFTVDIWNKGRMPATVRDVIVVRLRWRWHFSWWFNWWLRLIHRNSVFGNEALRVTGGAFPDEDEGTFPRQVAPTGYLRVRAVMDADLFKPSIHWVQAVIRRGDIRTSYSKSIPSPNHECLPRSVRKMLANRR